MQKNWDKWKSILKINNVTTFLLCILHKFKKYKEKGCILQKFIRKERIVVEFSECGIIVMYYFIHSTRLKYQGVRKCYVLYMLF